jgi:hypothetical protein
MRTTGMSSTNKTEAIAVLHPTAAKELELLDQHV